MKATHRTEELTSPLLDFFVAEAEGGTYLRTEENIVYRKTESGRTFLYQPSVDWRNGGPIIERCGISLRKTSQGWEADNNQGAMAAGPTALIAAMRVRVIMAFGYVLELEE